jgi:hypothetical protein
MEVLAEQLQSLVSGTTLPTIQNELSRLGLAQPTDGATTVAAPQASHSGRFAARRGLLVLAGLAAGVLLMAIWARFRQPEVTLLDVPGTSDLMATDESMRLRVVATPWAHVFVDGVQRETTPFSQPIVLSAGRHVVRLEHPQAPPEERVVEGQTGQIVLLSVHLHVQRPPQSSLQIEEAPEESTP